MKRSVRRPKCSTTRMRKDGASTSEGDREKVLRSFLNDVDNRAGSDQLGDGQDEQHCAVEAALVKKPAATAAARPRKKLSPHAKLRVCIVFQLTPSIRKMPEEARKFPVFSADPWRYSMRTVKLG